MQMTTLDLSDDMINVSDICDRVDQLTAEMPEGTDAEMYAWLEANPELRTLSDILASMVGYGSDTEWRGDWYPGHLIRDCYFTTYAREMLEDCGIIPRDFPSWVEIDWDATARNVRVDYSPVTIDGATYWYR